ncbi:MAG TPA: hypothetical protein VE594_03710 [Nitrososphaeraceae archaeon]|nr:hypothetical protein [Nitrososphaeraceae archaeon]
MTNSVYSRDCLGLCDLLRILWIGAARNEKGIKVIINKEAISITTDGLAQILV